MTDAAEVVFYFGPGSRYSYLAATQIPRLEAQTGARFVWRAVMSGDLIAGGPDPFAEESRRGQYASDYRHRDVARWARHYGVPYVEVADTPEGWRRRAWACVAADGLGQGAAFASALLDECHAYGRPPVSDPDYAALARRVGLDAPALVAAIDAPETAALYQAQVDEARAAGAFGVPTFVTADGALFFGQDRLPLLVDHLKA